MNLNKENNKKNEVNVNEISNYLFKDFPDCLNAKELAMMLGIRKTKLYELLQSGEIKSIKIGKDYKISKLNAIAYLYGGKQI